MITVRELTEKDWPILATLFGARGACGGCWCMNWRVPKGGKTWDAVKGEPNRKAMNKLVTNGNAHGMLAFDGAVAVGWCAFGKRAEFPRLETVKAYRRDDTDKIWCINCFFIAKEYRNQGVASILAEGAIAAIRKRKGTIIEAYPVPLTRDGKKLPGAFAYTGPETIFQQLGFTEIQRLSYIRPLYRLVVK